ncbi:MAG TPA: hypothetical protein VHC22_19740 [Pirellulales bacterium]|nr:hypothetical protein [Pirellulales bacterium]
MVASLKQMHRIEIQFDTKALTDAGVGSDTPITIDLESITLRSVLRLMLNDLDLTYVVGDGYLMITSKTEAENMLRVRVYPVRDLVTRNSKFRPPVVSEQAGRDDYSSVIDLITSTVDPTSWDEVGGPGSIKEDRNSGSITFSQTEEVHEHTRRLLAALRAARDKQLAVVKASDGGPQPQPPAKDGGLQIRAYRFLGANSVPSGRAAVNPMQGGMMALSDKEAAAAAANALPQMGAAAPQAAPAPAQKPHDANAAGSSTAAAQTDEHLADSATEIAQLLPKMVEPQSWQPKGNGFVGAVGDTLVVRQTREVQQQVAQFLKDVLPGRIAMSTSVEKGTTLQLAAPGPQVDWPAEADPAPVAGERQIEESLDGMCDVGFVETPFSEALKELAAKGNLKLWLDRKALSDAGVGTDTPITRQIQSVTLRTAFKLLLGELDLTYIIRDEVLAITSKTEAENMLVTKVYPVFDLVATPAGKSQQANVLEFRSLIDTITSTLGPTTWDEVGGPGAIKEFTNSGSLVISQTTEIHEEIAAYLRALREVAADQR